jgi:3',5'-cyclic AMP phosphodiesterase CpdA
MRIIQLSDTHISHLGGTPSQNMALLTGYLNDVLRPDLVVNTGDLVILDPDSQPDRETARALHQRIDAPLLVLPGNHDVGESGPDPWMGISVTSDRVAGYISSWGPDRFFRLGSADTGSAGWAFVGINSERMSSGLPEEAEQWDWLAGIAEQVRGMSVMLFLHKPLWFPGAPQPGVTVTEADRHRLISLFSGARLRVVANGHVHRYQHTFAGQILTVSSPSLTFATTPDPERGLGPGPSGIVEYLIDGDTVRADFHPVPGLHGIADAETMPEFTAAMAALATPPLPPIPRGVLLAAGAACLRAWMPQPCSPS